MTSSLVRLKVAAVMVDVEHDEPDEPHSGLVLVGRDLKSNFESPSLAARIRAIRAIADLTQTEFGSVVGVSQGSIKRWENGSSVPDVKHADTICELFGIDGNWLINGEASPPVNFPKAGGLR